MKKLWLLLLCVLPVQAQECAPCGVSISSFNASPLKSSTPPGPTVASQAQQLAGEIRRAEIACSRSLIQAQKLPRVFVRQARPNQLVASATACITPACATLNDLVKKTEDFLSDVDAGIPQQTLKTGAQTRTW
jgi:hypothetical protein